MTLPPQFPQPKQNTGRALKEQGNAALVLGTRESFRKEIERELLKLWKSGRLVETDSITVTMREEGGDTVWYLKKEGSR